MLAVYHLFHQCVIYYVYNFPGVAPFIHQLVRDDGMNNDTGRILKRLYDRSLQIKCCLLSAA